MIQEKIEKAGIEWMKHVNSRERSAPTRFWKYIKPLNKRLEPKKQAARRNTTEREGSIEYIKKFIESTFSDEEMETRNTKKKTLKCHKKLSEEE